MNDPANDDLLPQHADIDTSLAAARREHAERLAAVLDLDAGLTAILTEDEKADGSQATTLNPGRPRVAMGGEAQGEAPAVSAQAAVDEWSADSMRAVRRVAGLAPGTRVAGYEIVHLLGSGGMGSVYMARDEQLGRVVALKVLDWDDVGGARFMREARAVAAVDHQHIVPVYAVGEADGTQYIAMRLVPGATLREVFNVSGPLAPGRAAGFISPVASALDAAHAAGLVHRDVKPANILVDARRGRPEHLYLTDFGIASAMLSGATPSVAGQFLGTPDYAAPEQVQAAPDRPVDGRADQYALACVAFEALTGQVPFKRDLPVTVLYAHVFSPPPRATSIRPDLPLAVDGVIAKAMAKQPDDRFTSCDNFAEALREALGLARYDPSGRQFVAAPMAVGVEQTITEHVQGTVSLGVQAKQILALIDAFAARPEAPALITAVHELEDPDAPANSRKSAKGRLSKFAVGLSGKVGDATLNILGKYLESKLGL